MDAAREDRGDYFGKPNQMDHILLEASIIGSGLNNGEELKDWDEDESKKKESLAGEHTPQSELCFLYTCNLTLLHESPPSYDNIPLHQFS